MNEPNTTAMRELAEKLMKWGVCDIPQELRNDVREAASHLRALSGTDEGEIERCAQAIYELRERRNFPPDGHVKWREAPQSVRDYNCDLARACLETSLHAAQKAQYTALFKRACEVVHHASDCPAIGGNGDGDCACDAVPFLNDMERLIK